MTLAGGGRRAMFPRTVRAAGGAGSAGAALALALPLLASCGGGGGDSSNAADEGEPAAGEAEFAAGEAEPAATEAESAATEAAGVEEEARNLAAPGAPVVLMRTSLGDLGIELYPEEAPETVENFLRYVEDGFYDGTTFHRVVRGFVIQGGGFTPDMTEKQTREPISNEAQNGLRNQRGTLSMARTNDPHSATSQFFVNTRDNAMLDHTGVSPRGWGYAVFGKVISGMEAVDRIEAAPVVSRAGHNDVPETPVVIESATVIPR